MQLPVFYRVSNILHDGTLTDLHQKKVPYTLLHDLLEELFPVYLFRRVQSPFLLFWESFETFSCLF
jgi:hypothetical protein